MRLEPYWLDTAPAFGKGAAGNIEGHADVVVIGGGFTGLSAALALAKKGASVVLLESSRVVGEASGRNGGHCNNGLSLDFGNVVDRLGFKRARELYLAYDAAVDTVERVIAEEKIDCGFRRGGKIKLAAKPAHFTAMARSHELLLRDVDNEIDLVSSANIAAEIGSKQFHGGLIQRKSAQMHMGQFGVGLAEAAVRSGACIYEHAAVTAIRRSSGRHRISTKRGTIEAAQVLVATGPSSTGPFSYFRRRIIPVGSFVTATEPLTETLANSIMPRYRTATTTRAIGHYFRRTSDNRLLFGGRARFTLPSRGATLDSGRILQLSMRAMFPQLESVGLDYCWSGLVDMTADRMPRAGEHSGLFYCMGYSGHGTQMSVHMGRLMAEVINGNEGVNPLRDLKWAAIPGHFGLPWFMPILGAYYRFKDRFS